MKKTIAIFLSTLACALAMAWFLNLRMPFYMGDQDPAYRYLPGFIDMASFHKTHFRDHPGLPLQIMGAALVRVTYALTGSHETLLDDVLTRPESYLAVVGWILLGVVALSIYILGITALKVNGSLTGAIMLQISCVLVSRFMLYRLVGVTANALLLGLTFLLMSLILTYVNKSYPERLQLKWPLTFGLLSATMVMTKFTVLPLIIIPAIILSSWKSRVYYLAALSLVATLLLLAFANDPERFWNFSWQVISRSGVYGGGDVGWDFADSLDNMLRTIKSDPLFVIILTTLMSTSLKTIISDRSQGLSELTKDITMISITAICLAALGQWLVVVKHFRQYYLLPGSLLLVLGVYLYWIKYYTPDQTRKTALKVGFGGIILLLIFQAPMIYSWASWRRGYRDSCMEIERHIQNKHQGVPFATALSAVTLSYALADFNHFYSNRSAAGSTISRIYPQESVIYPRDDQPLAEALARTFSQRPSLIIVNNKTKPEVLMGLDLSFLGRYHSVYVLNK